MFEELYEPVPDTAKFLERIGLSGFVPSIDLSSLNTMIKAYRETIPFENLSVWYERKTPSLATADLYKKMIIGRRGGYCFELNGLFCAFLKTLGFDIYSIAVFVREDVDGLTDLGHRASICTLGRRKYLVEVGYGERVSQRVSYESILFHFFSVDYLVAR